MNRLYIRRLNNVDEEMVWITPSEAVNVKAAVALGLISKNEILALERGQDYREAA
jgi:hypothetical protein